MYMVIATIINFDAMKTHTVQQNRLSVFSCELLGNHNFTVKHKTIKHKTNKDRYVRVSCRN